MVFRHLCGHRLSVGSAGWRRSVVMASAGAAFAVAAGSASGANTLQNEPRQKRQEGTWALRSSLSDLPRLRRRRRRLQALFLRSGAAPSTSEVVSVVNLVADGSSASIEVALMLTTGGERRRVERQVISPQTSSSKLQQAAGAALMGATMATTRFVVDSLLDHCSLSARRRQPGTSATDAPGVFQHRTPRGALSTGQGTFRRGSPLY